jgi:hypothetical protein
MNAITLPNFKSLSYEIYDDTDTLIEKSIIEEPSKELIQKKITEPNEQLGKMFEMAICLLYDIPYDGGYKYTSDANKENTEKMKARIVKLLELFPMCKHSAKCGSPYDYTSIENPELHLSAKTTQKDGKICPQVIGQPSRKKFCEYFKLDSNNKIIAEINGVIKQYIQDNIFELLKEYFSHTFDCPMIYYNKKADVVQFITVKQQIEWSQIGISFSHIKKNKLWNESSCICIEKNGKLITLGEFQVHNHRDCIKFRWCFKVLLTEFAEYFNITAI